MTKEVRPKFSRAYFSYLHKRMHEKPPRRRRWPGMHGFANQFRTLALATPDDIQTTRGGELCTMLRRQSSGAFATLLAAVALAPLAAPVLVAQTFRS